MTPSTCWRLTEREIARRIGTLQQATAFWGLQRLEATAVGDTAKADQALACQRELLRQARPLRRMLAERREARV